MESEWRKVHRSEEALSLLILGVDHFKPLIDSYAHPFGDKVLKCVASVLVHP
ncbi:diguanylate cyclase [Comamonas testosteroni]|uniref:diguanylate cyclase n=1 Tax=Comamonas testosteroni TaxID=285 RepID=UPI002646C7B9|nr:diguanylate cyclase [Comamonas testosteroni]WQG69559.1 diguanylate cyclase [Comamonas testosteroni]